MRLPSIKYLFNLFVPTKYPKYTGSKLPLIKALRAAADKLDDCGYYNWGSMESCNCGVVAQQILQIESWQLDEVLTKNELGKGPWSDHSTSWDQVEPVKTKCGITKLPLNKVFRELALAGMNADDVNNLEFLADETVLREAGIVRTVHNWHYKDKQNVIKYLRAWANILCRAECKKETNNA